MRKVLIRVYKDGLFIGYVVWYKSERLVLTNEFSEAAMYTTRKKAKEAIENLKRFDEFTFDYIEHYY